MCNDISIIMFADNTVIQTHHGKSATEVAKKLTKAMQKVTVWLHNSCLTLNLEKPVKDCPDVSINGQTINNVDKFKYLGVTLEPTLSFKKHVKKRRNTLKYNLADVRYIRYSLKVEAVSDYVSECRMLCSVILLIFFFLYKIVCTIPPTWPRNTGGKQQYARTWHNAYSLVVQN